MVPADLILRKISEQMDEASIKKNIEMRRNEMGLSQQEIADRLGISRNGYRKIERGSTRLFNENLTLLADAFDCRVEDFLIPYGSSSRRELTELVTSRERRISELEGLLREKSELLEIYRRKK